jgi:hypothetical protein
MMNVMSLMIMIARNCSGISYHHVFIILIMNITVQTFWSSPIFWRCISNPLSFPQTLIIEGT